MRTMTMTALGLLVSLASGCSPVSMATTAYKVVRGAQANVTIVHGELAPSTLRAYKSIHLGEVTTDLEPICTPEVLAKVRTETRAQLASSETAEIFHGSGKVLRFNILCRFFKEKGLIGGEGRLDWWVTLQDNETGQPLGVVFVEGLSGSPLQHGITDMTKENTSELVAFIGKLKEDKTKARKPLSKSTTSDEATGGIRTRT